MNNIHVFMYSILLFIYQYILYINIFTHKEQHVYLQTMIIHTIIQETQMNRLLIKLFKANILILYINIYIYI